jgi:hypothetical protein
MACFRLWPASGCGLLQVVACFRLLLVKAHDSAAAAAAQERRGRPRRRIAAGPSRRRRRRRRIAGWAGGGVSGAQGPAHQAQVRPPYPTYLRRSYPLTLLAEALLPLLPSLCLGMCCQEVSGLHPEQWACPSSPSEALLPSYLRPSYPLTPLTPVRPSALGPLFVRECDLKRLAAETVNSGPAHRAQVRPSYPTYLRPSYPLTPLTPVRPSAPSLFGNVLSRG